MVNLNRGNLLFKIWKRIFLAKINEIKFFDLPNIAIYHIYCNDVEKEMVICSNGDYATLDQYLTNNRINAQKSFFLLQSNLNDLEFNSTVKIDTNTKVAPDQCTITLHQVIKFEGGQVIGLQWVFVFEC